VTCIEITGDNKVAAITYQSGSIDLYQIGRVINRMKFLNKTLKRTSALI
jgi:hypothetical protein